MKRSAPLRRRTPPKPHRQPTPTREEWENKRLALYARSGGRCEAGLTAECRAGRGDLNRLGMQAHHRKLRSQGGGHGLVNLLALCPFCHEWAHRHPAEAQSRGLICPRFHDPAVWAVILADGRIVQLTRTGTYVEVAPSPKGAA